MNELTLTSFQYNKDQKTRDELLGLDSKLVDETYAHFSNLDISTLKELIAQGFVDLDEQQNDAPTIREFVEFMELYPNMKAHGYAIGHPRSDYRISIEGVVGQILTYKNMSDFIDMFRTADEFKIEESGYGRCWYD